MSAFADEAIAGFLADHTLSVVPNHTRREVALAIQMKHIPPSNAVASTPNDATLVLAHSPSTGSSQAINVVSGMASVLAAASQSR